MQIFGYFTRLIEHLKKDRVTNFRKSTREFSVKFGPYSALDYIFAADCKVRFFFHAVVSGSHNINQSKILTCTPKQPARTTR